MQMFTGIEYLKIDIASNFGLDKALWSERLAWFEEHKDKLDQMLSKADEPALYFAGVNAWKAVQKGEAIGYPISLDATSSGLQLLACLTGDRSAAMLCNVVNTGRREDAYTSIYQHMVNVLGEDGKIERRQTKDAIMTALYGSTAMPKQIFGEGELLQIFKDTMLEKTPACWELNQFFLDAWDPTVDSHDWVLPDNFHVHVKVMGQVSESVNFLNKPYQIYRNVNAPMERGRSLGANTIHS